MSIGPNQPPFVEPLDDLAWSRVERGIWARLDADEPAPAPIVAPRRASALYGAAAIAAAAALVFVVLRDRDEPVAPAVPVQIAGADHTPMRIEAGATPSSVTAGDVFVTLDAHSALLMTRDPQAPVAILDAGAAWFTVAPRSAARPFVVVAGEITVRVIGTRFRVARTGALTTVNVDHGVVEVSLRGATQRVHAGEQWSSPPRVTVVDAAPAVTPPPPPPPPPPPAVTPPRDRPPAGPTERERFERLSGLEVTDPDAALAGYLALARGASSWAQLSLFAAARLAVDRNDPRATSLLETYLRRFPTGPNADDARELIRQQKGSKK